VKPIMVSAHNPMSGARHLGHYVSTMKEWEKLQYEFELFIVVDDLIAHFLNPAERSEMQNRSFLTIQDFLAGGADPSACHFILTSMLPEALELMTLLSAHIELPYCERLYSQSYAGLLKTYHRPQVGLGKYPSIAEFIFPQIGLPALTIGLQTQAFQGGEEISGYVHIMAEIVRSFNEQHGEVLRAPRLHAPETNFLVGVDGTHMIPGNEITLSADPDEIKATVERITETQVIRDWYTALGYQDLARALPDAGAADQKMKATMTEVLIDSLARFREFRVTNKEIAELLYDGADVARSLISDTTNRVKAQMGIPVFY
jgi:tryptophanyl-tRNA synthetase